MKELWLIGTSKPINIAKYQYISIIYRGSGLMTFLKNRASQVIDN